MTTRELKELLTFALYQTEDGRTRIECRFEGETIWLTQKLMAELFQKDVRTINEHIQNVFTEGELAEEAVIRKAFFQVVQNNLHFGKVSREQADTLAEQEYDRFAARRRARLENDADADAFKLLEGEVKKLPIRKRQGKAER